MFFLLHAASFFSSSAIWHLARKDGCIPAPFEGEAPVQCKEDLDWRGVASRTSPCSIII